MDCKYTYLPIQKFQKKPPSVLLSQTQLLLNDCLKKSHMRKNETCILNFSYPNKSLYICLFYMAILFVLEKMRVYFFSDHRLFKSPIFPHENINYRVISQSSDSADEICSHPFQCSDIFCSVKIKKRTIFWIIIWIFQEFF